MISKVSTGDDSANESNLEIAKTHLQNVLSNYGLKMLDDFSSVFDAKNGKGNSEIIFAVRYAEGEVLITIICSPMQWLLEVLKIII